MLAVFHTPFGVSIVSVDRRAPADLAGLVGDVRGGVARRRIRLSTDLRARRSGMQWASCGDPPKDQSFLFAVIAIVLAILAWVLVPVVAYAIFS